MSCNFCLFFNLFVPKAYILKNFTWVIIHLDFVGFPFKTSKFKNDLNYIKYQFSHKFGKVYSYLNMYYSNIKITTFSKETTMSIWIILNNLVWIYETSNFCQYWDIQSCIHLVCSASPKHLNNVHTYVKACQLGIASKSMSPCATSYSGVLFIGTWVPI